MSLVPAQGKRLFKRDVIFSKTGPLMALAYAVCLSATLAACGANSNILDTAARSCSETMEVAIHEHSLAGNDNLCATSKNVTVIEFEHKGANPHENDSGAAGVDVIHYRIEISGTYTFSFEEDVDEPHYAIMKDSDGAQIFRVEAAGGSVTVDLEAGSYNLFFYHQGLETTVLFIKPDTSVTARKGGEAQYYSLGDVIKLGFTHKCSHCNLVKAWLPLSIFNRGDLSYANLTSATLSSSDLRNANFSHANLTSANLSHNKMYGINLSYATLDYADLNSSNLDWANLSHASLRYVTWRFSSLSHTNLTYTNLTGTITYWSGLLDTADMTGSYYIDPYGQRWNYFNDGMNSGWKCEGYC